LNKKKTAFLALATSTLNRAVSSNKRWQKELHTTIVQTDDGRVWDIGNRQYPPTYYHPGNRPCPECFVVNAWTERVLSQEPGTDV
jgi:hypothetical protein